MYNLAVSIYADPMSDMAYSIYAGKKRRLSDLLLQTMIDFSAAISILLLLLIVCYVTIRGIGTISLEFLTSVPSTINGTFGIAGNIVNTLYLIVLTLLIATPVGIGAAIYLNEYAKPGRLVRFIEFTTETLSGIPSIIFGLFGMIFFGSALGLQYSLLTGALTMTLMILPLITRNTQEALKTVPDSYRAGALGIGATKWYMIRTILIPSALPGIVTGVILAIGRIVGESAALLFTAGSGFLLPKSGLGLFEKILQPGGTLTIQLYLCMSKAQYDEAFGIAFILLLIVLIINFLTKYAVKKLDVGTVKNTDKTDGGAFGE